MKTSRMWSQFLQNRQTKALIYLTIAALLFWFVLDRTRTTTSSKENPQQNYLVHIADENENLNFDEDSDRNYQQEIDTTENPTTVQMITRVNPEDFTVNETDWRIFFAECGAPRGRRTRGEVLLFHGKGGGARWWADTGTPKFLCANGYWVAAVDLPGIQGSKGKTTPDIPIRGSEILNLVSGLISTLKMNKPVLVSASASGLLGLNFMVKRPQRLSGHIMLEPTNTDRFDPDEYRQVEMPTLLVYGDEMSPLAEESLQNLKDIPKLKKLVLPKVGHTLCEHRPLECKHGILKFLNRVYPKMELPPIPVLPETTTSRALRNVSGLTESEEML